MGLAYPSIHNHTYTQYAHNQPKHNTQGAPRDGGAARRPDRQPGPGRVGARAGALRLGPRRVPRLRHSPTHAHAGDALPRDGREPLDAPGAARAAPQPLPPPGRGHGAAAGDQEDAGRGACVRAVFWVVGKKGGGGTRIAQATGFIFHSSHMHTRRNRSCGFTSSDYSTPRWLRCASRTPTTRRTRARAGRRPRRWPGSWTGRSRCEAQSRAWLDALHCEPISDFTNRRPHR